MKYVVLSTDGNPDYYNLLPIVCHSWRKIGYAPIILNVGAPQIKGEQMYDVPKVDAVKDSTVAQLSRLFAWHFAEFNDDDILIIGDADMVIGKNIFTAPLPASYGFDLTGRSEIPMCYVEATVAQWREMMGDWQIPDAARSEDWYQYWSTDQQLLTAKAREYGFDRITFVDRGNNNKHGLPTGRWDRHDFAHIPDDIIDVHMPRNDWNSQFAVFKRLWPEDDVKWLYDYKDSVTLSPTEASWERSVFDKLRQTELDNLANAYPWFLEDVSNWCNHRPMLLLALSLTKGDVVELGSGDGSTEYLSSYCATADRAFRSFDYNKDWAEKTGSTWVEDWDANARWQQPCGLLFVDESPGEHRWISIRDMVSKADVIVVHDSEILATGYMLDRVYPLFKYILHYNHTGGGAGACILSNTIDVTVYKGLTLGAFRFDD